MKIFIGSSKETAQGTNSLLQQIAVIVSQAGFTPVKWNKVPTIFQAGRTTIENLESLITRENIDASIFIFSEKDKSWEREQNKNVPRSNVLFELGLFTAKLGRTKSIIIKNGNVEIPSDLLGVTYINCDDDTTIAEADIQQWLEELKRTQAINIPRISNEEMRKIEQTKLEIEKELALIKANGLEKIFNNQSEAVADFRKNYASLPTLPIKILCIRGESFVSNHLENWGSILSAQCKKTVILGNPSNEDLVKNRYNANKNPDETESAFLVRYRVDMQAVQSKIKSTSELYLHNETKLRFRMLFVDKYLYLSKFKETQTASQSEVIKIPNYSALYAVCEDHYNQILTNATKQ